MEEGWVCPRCGKVNAPFIASCDCKFDEVRSNADSECGCGGKHEWRITNNWNNIFGRGVTYTCNKCGQIKDIMWN